MNRYDPDVVHRILTKHTHLKSNTNDTDKIQRNSRTL